jgi:hypothetical protein
MYGQSILCADNTISNQETFIVKGLMRDKHADLNTSSKPQVAMALSLAGFFLSKKNSTLSGKLLRYNSAMAAESPIEPALIIVCIIYQLQ